MMSFVRVGEPAIRRYNDCRRQVRQLVKNYTKTFAGESHELTRGAR